MFLKTHLPELRSLRARNVGLEEIPLSFACMDRTRVKFDLANFSGVRSLLWRGVNCSSAEKALRDGSPCYVLRALGNVERIDLSCNRISKLDLNKCDEFLKRSTSLRSLNVSHNNMVSLNISKLLRLESLEILDISSNDFENLPLGIAS